MFMFGSLVCTIEFYYLLTLTLLEFSYKQVVVGSTVAKRCI